MESEAARAPLQAVDPNASQSQERLAGAKQKRTSDGQHPEQRQTRALERELAACGIRVDLATFEAALAPGGAATESLLLLQQNLEDDHTRADALLQDLDDYVLQSGKQALACLLAPLDSGAGDCVVKMVLNVHSTQTRVMQSLLQWVVEYAADEETLEAEKLQQDLPRLLLYQLRFLNFIEDGEDLAANLMECLSSVCQVCPESKRLPREIINIIPEILEDAQHGVVVRHLKQVLEEERELTVSIIDTLSNLRVPEEDMGELRATVLQILASAPFGDLPVAIQFLLESLGTANDPDTKRCKAQVMRDLRNRFAQICNEDIVRDEPSASQDSSGPPAGPAAQTAASTALQANNILAILQVLMRCLVARKDLCKIYLETVDGAAAGKEGGLSVIDVWILVGLRAHGPHLRRITTLIRQHVAKTMAIDVDLIRASVRGHRDVLDTQFKHFLDLAGMFLTEDGLSVRQRNDGVSLRRLRDAGRALYVSLFREFKEPYYRQELVVALVMHCGVSTEESAELEGALECMLDLSHKRRYVHALEPFVEFVKTLIHSAPQMQLRHCRMVFNVLSSFVVHRSNTEAGGAAWFHVLLRKLLTNPSGASRRAGAVGAVQLINAYARESSPAAAAAEMAARFSLFEDDDDDEDDDQGGDTKAVDDGLGAARGSKNGSASQNSSSSGRVESECKDVFDLALSSSRSSARTMATFCEELGAMVDGPNGHLGRLAQPIALYMVEELNVEFMERFCMSMPGARASVSSSSTSTSKPSRLRLPCFADLAAEPLFDENKGNNIVTINVLPNLAKGINDPRLQERYLYLAPMLRGAMALAGVAGKRDAMSALLGAPVLLATEDACKTFFDLPEADEDTEKAQGAICLSIYHMIDWTRELINVSAEDMEDAEVRRKIFARFDLLEEMHGLLEALVRSAKSTAVFAMLPIQRSEAPMLSMAASSSSSSSLVAQAGSASGDGSRAGSSKRQSHGGDDAALPKNLGEVLRKSYRPFRLQVFNLLGASAPLESHPHAARALVTSLFETVETVLNPKRSFFGKKSKAAGADTGARAGSAPTTPGELIEPLRALMRPLFVLATKQFQQLEDEVEGISESVLADCVLTNCKLVHEVARCPQSRTDRPFRTRVELVLTAYSMHGVDDEDADSKGDTAERGGASGQSASADDAHDRPPLFEAIQFVEKLLGSDAMARTETKLTLVELLVDLVPFVRSKSDLEDRVSTQCSKLLRRNHVEQSLTKATIGRLLDLHLRFDTRPLLRMEELIHDMASVAETPGSNGETFETLSIGTLPYFYEPVLRALLRALDTLDFQSHLPQRKAAGKRRAPGSGKRAAARKGKAGKRRKRRESGDESGGDDDDDDGDDNDDNDAAGSADDDDGEEDGQEDVDMNEGDDDDGREGASTGDAEEASVCTHSDAASSVAPSRRAPKKSVSDTLDDAEKVVNLIRKTILLTRMCPNKKTLLVMAVRQGRAIIERFMKIAMPFLSRFFRQAANQNKIVRIFRGLQQSTRQLQSICDSGKSNKDLSLVSAVPKLRKILESLILAAKGLCQASGTLSAFTTGNLKRRNVDGSLREDPILEADEAAE